MLQLVSGATWWADLIQWANYSDLDNELVRKVSEDLAAHKTSSTHISPFRWVLRSLLRECSLFHYLSCLWTGESAEDFNLKPNLPKNSPHLKMTTPCPVLWTEIVTSLFHLLVKQYHWQHFLPPKKCFLI